MNRNDPIQRSDPTHIRLDSRSPANAGCVRLLRESEAIMIITLNNAQQGHLALMALWQQAKAHLMAGQPMCVELKEKTRSAEASAKFHAMCADFARSSIEWAGKKRTAMEWKVLLISGHSIATKQGAEMVPGLENEFVNIRESSARMSIARMNSLIEYTYATGVELGVRFSCPETEVA